MNILEVTQGIFWQYSKGRTWHFWHFKEQ